MTNLLVATKNIDERLRLQEQFSLEDHYFRVPANESGTLEAIFRSISFEYFQNSPPLIVQKVVAFAENAVNSVFSLELLRDIIGLVKNQRDSLTLYRQYFNEIHRQIGDGEGREGGIGITDKFTAAEESDRLFDLAERGEMRLTRNLDCTDFQQQYEISFKIHCPLAISQKTQVPSMRGLNPEQKQSDPQQEANNISHIFSPTQNYYGNDSREWWKQQKYGNDSSKEISRFDCKAGNPLNQKSIGKLVIQQFKYDLNREIELARDINKHREVEVFKYKKMMKDKLLSAKLKKRKKK